MSGTPYEAAAVPTRAAHSGVTRATRGVVATHDRLDDALRGWHASVRVRDRRSQLPELVVAFLDIGRPASVFESNV